MASSKKYRVHGSGGTLIHAYNDDLVAGTLTIATGLASVQYAVATVTGGTANAIAVDTTTTPGSVILTGTATDNFNLIVFGN